MSDRERVLFLGLDEELEMLQAGNALPEMNIITLEGQARSGKGTTGGAVNEALSADGRSVKYIDQGKKYRALTYMGLMDKLDLHNPDVVTSFLGDPETRERMLGMMALIGEMDQDEEQSTLYSDAVKTAVSKIGQNQLSHGLAVGVMFDEAAEAAASGVNTLMIDGRAIEKYARQMDEDKVGMYVNGYYFECDSYIAARRVLKNFKKPDEMSPAEQSALLTEVNNISARNNDDAMRQVDPMQYPDHAYRLDLAAGLPNHPGRLVQEFDQLQETKIVAVNTSHTASIEQMTIPIVTITREMIRRADIDRAHWQKRIEWFKHQTVEEIVPGVVRLVGSTTR